MYTYVCVFKASVHLLFSLVSGAYACKMLEGKKCLNLPFWGIVPTAFVSLLLYFVYNKEKTLKFQKIVLKQFVFYSFQLISGGKFQFPAKETEIDNKMGCQDCARLKNVRSWERVSEREGEREGARERGRAPMLIGDSTRVLMYVFLVCASPPLLFSGPLAEPDLCHHLPAKHFLLPRWQSGKQGRAKS